MASITSRRSIGNGSIARANVHLHRQLPAHDGPGEGDPSAAEIEARKAEVDAMRLAAFDARPAAPVDDEQRREKRRVYYKEYRAKRKLRSANREPKHAQPAAADVDDLNRRAVELDATAEEARLEAKVDCDTLRNCPIRSRSLKSNSTRSFNIWQRKLELSIHAHQQAAIARGTLNRFNVEGRATTRVAVPEGGPREMTRADICNVDLGSLAAFNRLPGDDDVVCVIAENN